jgi:alpha-ribazole phosphatase
MRLFLVRHPRPLVAEGVCYGSTDLEPDPHDLARVQAALRSALPGQALLFSSPMRRCADLARRLGYPEVVIDARLAELHFGDWEMQAWDAIPRDQIDAWADALVDHRPGGGESVLQMAVRLADFYAHAAQLPNEDIVVICHAGSIRLLRALHAGLPPREAALQAAGAPHMIGYGETLVLELP